MSKSTVLVSITSPTAKLQLPPASTFSFKAPFPASSSASTSTSSSVKQRRVSLALPSSPRLVPAWSFRDDTGLDSHVAETVTSCLIPERRGKMRKIANDADDDDMSLIQEKKPRKKWTDEETQMLVDGCNLHGVGNWKTILSDPNLEFDNRSPVDLKDRFRTRFPDAYKQHYPNAKTHLSSRVRSTLPDGSSLFEKTRNKKRRPFTEEEDRALKAGYQKHGTVWATIVKDPVFQEQNRRSTDLRDRFRNAFPELYQAAGYKPRNASKKLKGADGAKFPVRAATDDQLSMSTTGPIRRRRAHTSQGLFRGGTKSVPQSAAVSEDEDSSAGEEESELVFKRPPIPVFVANVSTSRPAKVNVTSSSDPFSNEMDMETIDPLSDPLSIPDFMPSSQSEMDAHSQTWSSGTDTPIHASHHAWSTATGSPASSHLSTDYLMNSANSSPFHRRSDGMGMIGKSAWGTQDWFSANPRLDPGSSGSGNLSYLDGGVSPSSPFSFHNLNHGVLDRYDLFPSSFPHDFSSEVGVGDSHSTFSDDVFPPSGFRGFTHHSNYAGDLIFGARTHQPQQSYYGSGFGFGTAGLGLTGMSQSTGIHPMQLHTPALPGIDEIELTGITLNDQADTPHDAMEDTVDADVDIALKGEPQGPSTTSDRFNLDDLVDLSHELHSTPPATPITQTRPLSNFHHFPSVHSRSISVPPSEARSGHSRPGQVHTNSQHELSPTRSLPFFDSLSHEHPSKTPILTSHPPSSFPQSPSQIHSSSASGTLPSHDASRSPNDLYDLSFLDLHYYGHTSNASVGCNSGMGNFFDNATSKSESTNYRRGQALDLAQSAASALRSLGIPSSLGQHIPQVSQNAVGSGKLAGRSHSLHQRGQSAVCPQDLLLRKGNDNKRKRASWDGGHV